MPSRVQLARSSYSRALVAARERSTAATWRRLVRAGQNLRDALAEERRAAVGASAPILLVDDDVDARETVRRLLESRGHRVVLAEHGLAALDVLRRRRVRPAAILLELELPVMTGWELRRELLRDPALEHIPVIVTSGCEARNEVPAALRLDKPYEPHDLFAALALVAPR